MDGGYRILLSQLHSTSQTAPDLDAIQPVLSHHLATVAPSPTPLAATAISSPLFLGLGRGHADFTTQVKAHQTFSTAFRHAVHLKYHAIVDSTKARKASSSSKLILRLGKSDPSVLAQWVTDVVRGLRGGECVLRLAACGGLLLGVEDVKLGEGPGKGIDCGLGARLGVEDEIVLSVAEVMDKCSPTTTTTAWEREFQPPEAASQLRLAMVLASQSLPLVSQRKFEALPLPALAQLLVSTIASTFQQGGFLSSSDLAIPAISRLTARALSSLLDPEHRSTSRRNTVVDDLRTVSDSLDVMREMAKTVERDWLLSPSPSKETWTAVKAFLFTIITIHESVLSAVIYTPLHPSPSTPTPSTLALQSIHTLSHLSFVISHVGGLPSPSSTSTTPPGTKGGFERLRATFDLALDLLVKTGNAEEEVERYVKESCALLRLRLRLDSDSNSNSKDENQAHTRTRVKTDGKEPFVLASIAPLVPVLSHKCIRDSVWIVCRPHLHLPDSLSPSLPSSSPTSTSTTHQERQTYELAHALVVAILGSYALRPESPSRQRHDGGGEDESKFMRDLVVFYASCLIDNSGRDKLTTPQLRSAFAVLVRCAACVTPPPPPPDSKAHVPAPGLVLALPWYCVQLLLDKIAEVSSSSGGERSEVNVGDMYQHRHQLTLTLISTLSSVPAPLLVRLLDRIRDVLLDPDVVVGGGVEEQAFFDPKTKSDLTEASQPQEKQRKKELVKALRDELLDRIGCDGCEKGEQENGLGWWYANLPRFEAEVGEADVVVRSRL